jgi:hypothetical protein
MVSYGCGKLQLRPQALLFSTNIPDKIDLETIPKAVNSVPQYAFVWQSEELAAHSFGVENIEVYSSTV